MCLEFEWDEKKENSNIQKHGITFKEASTVFSDFLSSTIPDPLHSDAEERYIIIGRSDKQRVLVVVHTERCDAIRIISARMASSHELKLYGENR